MPVTARGIPRFLPTLTEVVQAPAALHSAEPEPERAATVPLEELVPPLVQAPPAVRTDAVHIADMDFQAQLESRVRQIVASALAAQVERITGQLMGELEPAVRQLVRESLARHGHLSEPL